MGTGEVKSPNSEHKTRFTASLKEHRTAQTRKLPKGLVGSKSTANVKVNGVDCRSLLDTGSQVTTVSQSFYNSHLSDYTIHPVSDILEIEGANGQSVPYAGYVQVRVQFPREFIASEPEVETLALIVPDVRSNSDIPVLIGTNALDPLYEQFCDDSSLQAKSYCGYQQVLRTLQLGHKQNSDGQLGFVKLRGPETDIIPAGQKVVLEGFVNVSSLNNEKWALVEQPTISSLPGGIFTDGCLISIPTQSPYKIPVVLRNETRPIIKPRTRRTPIQPDERPLDSEEEDDSPLFYPVEMVETEARVREPVSMTCLRGKWQLKIKQVLKQNLHLIWKVYLKRKQETYL